MAMTNARVQILPLRRPEHAKEHSKSNTDPKIPATRAGTPSSKKTRAGGPKVRSGCITCKIRRVKCGEENPQCFRCTSTGRTCDGYAQPPPRKNARDDASSTVQIRTNPGSRHGNQAELQSLQFFHCKTAPQLSSYFDAEFWTRLVFQMSHEEDAIRHAMIALGSLAAQRGDNIDKMPQVRARVLSQSTGVDSDFGKLNLSSVKGKVDPNDAFALRQYNKAIVSLSSRISEPDVTLEVAILACILFVCFEFLRGDAEQYLKHFNSGVGIVKAALQRDTSSQNGNIIKEHMLPFFNRLELLANLFGQEATWKYPVSVYDAVPNAFTDMRDARDSLVHLLNHAMRLIRHMRYKKHQQMVLPDDIARQTTLQRQLDAWKSRLDDLVNSAHLTEHDLEGAKVLRAHHLICSIWSGTGMRRDECASDEYLAEFEEAISLAEAVRAFASNQNWRQQHSSNFLFDMEIVSPLYFISTKCRHPVLRRRAITLLKLTMRREGLWDSYMSAAIAERTTALEEQHLTTLDGSELPLEADRIHTTHIRSEVGGSPKRHVLTHFLLPDGLDGKWRIWCEEIVLEACDASSVGVWSEAANLAMRGDENWYNPWSDAFLSSGGSGATKS